MSWSQSWPSQAAVKSQEATKQRPPPRYPHPKMLQEGPAAPRAVLTTRAPEEAQEGTGAGNPGTKTGTRVPVTPGPREACPRASELTHARCIPGAGWGLGGAAQMRAPRSRVLPGWPAACARAPHAHPGGRRQRRPRAGRRRGPSPGAAAAAAAARAAARASPSFSASGAPWRGAGRRGRGRCGGGGAGDAAAAEPGARPGGEGRDSTPARSTAGRDHAARVPAPGPAHTYAGVQGSSPGAAFAAGALPGPRGLARHALPRPAWRLPSPGPGPPDTPLSLGRSWTGAGPRWVGDPQGAPTPPSLCLDDGESSARTPGGRRELGPGWWRPESSIFGPGQPLTPRVSTPLEGFSNCRSLHAADPGLILSIPYWNPRACLPGVIDF